MAVVVSLGSCPHSDQSTLRRFARVSLKSSQLSGFAVARSKQSPPDCFADDVTISPFRKGVQGGHGHFVEALGLLPVSEIFVSLSQVQVQRWIESTNAVVSDCIRMIQRALIPP